MYSDIPLWLSLFFVIGGLAALAWSSDAFVDSSAKIARILGISPFIIGMVIIGFGTSAPELCVSALSGIAGHSNIAIGNAYGSCAFNILAILGIAALIRPIVVKPSITFLASPLLIAITLVSWQLLRDGSLSRVDSLLLAVGFLIIMPLYCWYDQRGGGSPQMETPSAQESGNRILIALKVLFSLAVLVGSSHFLVWGSVDLARQMGVSELLIGLTIVAIGTSLPELASAIASARRGEHEFVMGNIVGSNLFNMLAVVGIAGSISPITDYSPYVLTRDVPTLIGATLSIMIFGINWRRPRAAGSVNRIEGALWILLFVVYTALMIIQEVK